MPESDYVLTKQKVVLKKVADGGDTGGATAGPKQMVLQCPDEREWDLVSVQPEPNSGKELLVIWKLRT